MVLPVGVILSIALAVLVLIVLVISSRQKEKLLEQLAELAGQRGWQFEKKPSRNVDCVIRGQYSDIHWEMKYVTHDRSFSGRDSENAESIIWFSADAAARDGALIFFPRLGSLPANAAPESLAGLGLLAMTLLNNFFRQAGIDTSRSSPQNAGSADFQRKYICMAPDGSAAQKVAAALETQLGSWPETKTPFNMPAVIIDASGVTVRINRTSTPQAFQYKAAELITPIGIAAVNAAR